MRTGQVFFLAFLRRNGRDLRTSKGCVRIWELEALGVDRDCVFFALLLGHPALLGVIFSLVRPGSLPSCIKIGNTIWEMFHLFGNLHFSRGWPTSFDTRFVGSERGVHLIRRYTMVEQSRKTICRLGLIPLRPPHSFHLLFAFLADTSGC